MKYTSKDLLAELRQVYRHYGGLFTPAQFRRQSSVSMSTLTKHFGSFEKALIAARKAEAGSRKKPMALKPVEPLDPVYEEDAEDTAWQKGVDAIKKKNDERRAREVISKAQKGEVLRESISDALMLMQPSTIQVIQHPKAKLAKTAPECVLWFEFSDLQLGTYMTLEEMGGLNEHDWAIWQQKLAVWKTAAIEKIRRYAQDFLVSEVVIACLGDMVEGHDIFAGQAWQVDKIPSRQVAEGAKDVAEAFAEIFASFPHLHFQVFEVYGNHGRIGKKGETPYQNSMDMLFQHMLDLRLKTFHGLSNYEYHPNTDSWFFSVKIFDKLHVLMHGDKGMKPAASTKPSLRGAQKWLVDLTSLLKHQVDYFHCGHFHTDWQLSVNDSHILINGSFIGTSVFSATQMHAGGPPVQLMHVFTPTEGLAATERIVLSPKREASHGMIVGKPHLVLSSKKGH